MSRNISPSDISKLKNQLFKKYNVRSERELMKKLLGTSDKKEIRQILLSKLNNLPPNDPLAKMAKKHMKKNSGKSMANELLDGLSPEQRRQLKSLLTRNRK